MRASPPVRRRKRRKSKQCTFRNSGTPVRRTTRQKSKIMHCQEFWDCCAQNKTSEISTIGPSGILGLLCAEQNVGNLKNELSIILGLLCAEQNVGNLKNCTFINSGTPVRRGRRPSAAPPLWFPRHMSFVSTLRYAQCSQPTRRRRPSAASTKGGDLRPPPFVVSFVLPVNTGHILVLRRKTCALLRAKTSALL